MNSLEGLIVRLDRATGLDRRLDAEIVVATLAPQTSRIDAVMGLDGWDIVLTPADEREVPDCWMEAADMPPLTGFLDAACDFAHMACPTEAGRLIVRALRKLDDPANGATAADVAGRAARLIAAELLRTVASRRAALAQVA